METDDIPISDELSIPHTELQFRFTTGGGPGGQHVNKTATRVTLFFDIANSPSLNEVQRARLLDRLATRVDRQGILHIDVHDSRSQWQNRQRAITRLQALLGEALDEPPERLPTQPSLRSKEDRLIHKRRRGVVKQGRRMRWED